MSTYPSRPVWGCWPIHHMFCRNPRNPASATSRASWQGRRRPPCQLRVHDPAGVVELEDLLEERFAVGDGAGHLPDEQVHRRRRHGVEGVLHELGLTPGALRGHDRPGRRPERQGESLLERPGLAVPAQHLGVVPGRGLAVLEDLARVIAGKEAVAERVEPGAERLPGEGLPLGRVQLGEGHDVTGHAAPPFPFRLRRFSRSECPTHAINLRYRKETGYRDG